MRRAGVSALQASAAVMFEQATELVMLVNMYRPLLQATERLPDPNLTGTPRAVARRQLEIWTAERDRLVVLLLRYLSIEDVRGRRMDALPPSHVLHPRDMFGG